MVLKDQNAIHSFSIILKMHLVMVLKEKYGKSLTFFR